MALVFFSVRAKLAAVLADEATDSDYDPTLGVFSADVTFTPLIKSGDVVRVFDASPPTMYVPVPITAQIDNADGLLKLRTTADSGGTGTYAPLRLLGNSDSLDLQDGSSLYYSFKFANIRIDNRPSKVVINGGAFEAPDYDTTVDLIDHMAATGTEAVGITRLAPGAVRLTAENTLQFSYGGVDIPSAVELDVVSDYDPRLDDTRIPTDGSVGWDKLDTDAHTALFPLNGKVPVDTTSAQTLTSKTLTSPKINRILDSNGNPVLYSGATSSAVNYLYLYNAAAGGQPQFISAGADDDIGLTVTTKGTGRFTVYSPTGQAATISGSGPDAAHDLNLVAKGAGVVTINGAAAVYSGGALGTPASGTLTNCTGLPQSGVTGLDTALSGKEPTIAAGTTGQYWRGDKSWQTLDKTAVGLGNVDDTADSAKSVASAATLTTARTIAGVSFDGSANIDFASTAVAVSSLEVGHESDTTVARSAAGVLTVEGVTVATHSVVSVTGSQTLDGVAGRHYIVLLKSGAVPVLPTAVGNTSVYQVKNVHTAAITLSTTSSQTVEGQASLSIEPRECFTLVSDNVNWVII